MKLSNKIYNYVYQKLYSASKNKLATKALEKTKNIEKMIDPSDIKINFIDSRTLSKTPKTNATQHISEILARIPERVRKEVAKYPKGTFKRTNTLYTEPLTKKRHIIAYEGIKVDFDITTEGDVLPKVRTYIAQ